MKLFSYIFTFYLVLLAVIPCCTFDGCPEDKTQTAQSTDHESDDADCGSCSPFFNCEGCSSVTINVEPLSFIPCVIPEPKVYTDFIPSAVDDIHYDFWQPPRLI